MRRLVFLLAAAAFAAAVPSAGATLVYSKADGGADDSIWSARDDGGAAKRIAPNGQMPRVSPDGKTVVFESYSTAAGSNPRLIAVAAAGGKRRTLLDPAWGADTLAWSPDSTTVAALTGSELGTKRLVLINVATGVKRVVALGQFYGVSFSPTGGAIVYARAIKSAYPSQSSLWVAPVSGGPPVPITIGHSDLYPVWGPRSVVFARQRKPVRRYDAWKQDLFEISPQGGGAEQLTHQQPSFLLSGLTPLSMSADGSRVLAVFGGQDTAFAQTIDERSGVVRTVNRPADNIVGSVLSRDGSTILGSRGDIEGGGDTQVITVPYGGGKVTVLAHHAYNPDWNR